MTAEAISSLLESVRFGQRPIQIESVLTHRHRTIIDLQLGLPPLARMQEGDFSEYNHLTVSIELTQLTRAGLLHQLMDALLRESDRQVAEQFRFQALPASAGTSTAGHIQPVAGDAPVFPGYA